MSIRARRRKQRRKERSALQMVEEGFHLLRTIDLSYYVWFYLGAVPFAVGLLYFTADQGRSGLAGQSAPGAAVLMTILYFWLRFCQARFCGGLWDTISPGHLPKRSFVEKFRAAAALFFLQALWLPMMVIGLFFALPLGWVIAALQNFTVLSETKSYGDRPLRSIFSEGLRHSHSDWAQNHGILIVIGIVGLFVWINLVATCVVVMSFGKSFFGVESVFTISPNVAIMNTTFLSGSLLLTWLVLSPMLKAVYTLRCFYEDSRNTGADLLSRLARCRQLRRKQSSGASLSANLGRKAAVLAGGLVLSFGTTAKAESVPAVSIDSGSQALPEDSLRSSIDRTMEQKKYQWQLSRKLSDEYADELENESWLSRRIRDLAEATKAALRQMAEWMKAMLEKWKRNPKSSSRPSGEFDSGILQGISSTLSIGLVVLVGLLAGWLSFVMYRKYKGRAPAEVEESMDAGAIDLHSEEIVASQLPEDEWMRLAREQMSKGDARLAVRALFLATLSKLGEEGLLRIARFKTNRDYRVELGRRARKATDLRNAFAENTKLFECAWYGWHPVSEEDVSAFLKNHEAIAREATRVVKRRETVPDGVTASATGAT